MSTLNVGTYDNYAFNELIIMRHRNKFNFTIDTQFHIYSHINNEDKVLIVRY